jgi:hypothetical protein
LVVKLLQFDERRYPPIGVFLGCGDLFDTAVKF